MKFLFIGTEKDAPYTSILKSLLAGNQCMITTAPVSTRSELITVCAKHNIDAIFTTSPSCLATMKAAQTSKKKPSIDNYAGSIFHLTSSVEVLIIPPLEQFMTVNHGKHLAERYLRKLTHKDRWYKQSEFLWELATPANLEAHYADFAANAIAISVDIETKKENLRISCVGFCAVYKDMTTMSIVIPLTDEFMLAWIAKFNALPQAKIMQNGQYDCAYFLRYGIPPTNYLFDTLNAFHSWYSEMPKSLDFLVAYMLRDFIYWKDESDTLDIMQYYQYNAKDTWATANVWMAMIAEMPAWAWANYKIEFPMIFPCTHAAMEGMLIDAKERDRLWLVENKKLESSLDDVRASLGKIGQHFNPSSPVQVKTLLKVLGCGDLPSSDAKNLAKAKTRHPLNNWLLSRITNYREARKLLSNYLDASLLGGRLMYSLNPAGTDTGRLASKDSAFWCGAQIQNIPLEVKSMMVPDEGWLLAEIDYSQSEARCVAYLSGDEALIAAVESPLDYHAVNAEGFFGIPYADVMQMEKDRKAGKIVGMTIRDLSKRTNHGANYNMGEGVMLDTMGQENVLTAKKLLGLPATLTLKEVCRLLLDRYANLYKHVKGRWYDSIKQRISMTKMLVSPLGWTRYCFGNPLVSKPALNAYVAHEPQNLSVSVINKAFYAVWLKYGLTGRIRIKAQVHDSLLFQYRKDDAEVVAIVAAMMRIPVKVIGSDGVERLMVIPADIKSGLLRWKE